MSMKKNRDYYRFLRLRRLKFTTQFEYMQRKRDWQGQKTVKGSYVDRTPTEGSWNSYPRLIETVNWNMRKKK